MLRNNRGIFESMTGFEPVLKVLPFKLHTFPKFTKLWLFRMWESNPHENHLRNRRNYRVSIG